MIKKYQKEILKKMGLKPNKKTLDNLSEKELYKYNTLRQKKLNKKKYNYLEITEPGASEKDIFSYNNILEWDKDNFNFQEKAREEDTKKLRKSQKEKKAKNIVPKYKAKKYKTLYMPGDWFRVIEKDMFSEKEKLTYGQLESARSYVYINAIEELEELINKKYPNILHKPYNKKMFEKIPNSKFLKMADYEIRAAGKEKELEKTKKELRKEYDNIEKDVVNNIEKYSEYTFLKIGEGKIWDNFNTFIIGGKKAAKKIDFKTFLIDFYDKEQPVEVLDKEIKKIVRKYRKKLKI